MEQNQQEQYENRNTSLTKGKIIALCLAIIVISVGLGITAWLLIRSPVTYGAPGERLQETSRQLTGYDGNANAKDMVIQLVKPYGHTVKTTQYTLSAITLPGYKFKVPADNAKVTRAILDDISDADVDTISKKIEADMRSKGFIHKTYGTLDSYYVNKDFICNTMSLSAEVTSLLGESGKDDGDPDVEAPFVQVACASIADYIKSAEFYKPLYEAIVADPYQYYDITMLSNSPIESTTEGYWRLEAASVSLADTDLSLEHGVANRAWFYKAPEGEWKLLQDSVSSLPSCKSIEADSDAKKAFAGSKCWDVKKENGTTTREVR